MPASLELTRDGLSLALRAVGPYLVLNFKRSVKACATQARHLWGVIALPILSFLEREKEFALHRRSSDLQSPLGRKVAQERMRRLCPGMPL